GGVPQRSATSTAAGLSPPTSKSQQMPPNTRSRSTVFCIKSATGPVGYAWLLSTMPPIPMASASATASAASTLRCRCGSGPWWQCISTAPTISSAAVRCIRCVSARGREQLEQVGEARDTRTVDRSVAALRIEKDREHPGAARALHVDLVDVADVDRFLGPRATGIQRQREDARIRLLDAHEVRVDDDA